MNIIRSFVSRRRDFVVNPSTAIRSLYTSPTMLRPKKFSQGPPLTTRCPYLNSLQSRRTQRWTPGQTLNGLRIVVRRPVISLHRPRIFVRTTGSPRARQQYSAGKPRRSRRVPRSRSAFQKKRRILQRTSSRSTIRTRKAGSRNQRPKKR